MLGSTMLGQRVSPGNRDCVKAVCDYVKRANVRFPKRELDGSMSAAVEKLLSRDWFRQTLAVLGIGLLVSLIGPFGSFDEMGLPIRMAFWMTVVALSWLQWLALDWLADAVAGHAFGAKPWPWWLQGVAVTLLGAALLAVEVPLLRGLLGHHGSLPFTEFFAWIASISLLIYAGVSGIIFWAQAAARSEPDKGSAVPIASSGEVRFQLRLPPDRRGPLICLKTEDHYLRVTTVAGETLILMRMKDAVAELADVDGRQVHRSYWVARAAVRQSWRAGRKRRLTLDNGLEVPVSDSFAPELKAAGWFDRSGSGVPLDKRMPSPNIEATRESG